VEEITASSRLTAMQLLLQADPEAARALVGDEEVDALFAEVVRTVASAGTCDPTAELGYTGGRPGFYANQLVAADELRRTRPPSGAAGASPCRRWCCAASATTSGPEIAAEYAAHLPGAVLREAPGAGHLIRADQPEAYDRALVDFLDELARR
jgi:proline iminopeptidase